MDQVANEIRNYFQTNRISGKQAAAMLNLTQSAVSLYLAGRPFNEKIANKWADTFGFDPDYLVSGEGKLVKGSTKRNPCPKTPQLLSSQTRLVAQGYKFRKMEQEALGDIPAAEILLSGNASASNRTFSELVEEARKEKNEGETNIFYWQEKALTEMKQELSNKEERLSAIEKMIGSIVGLGAATMAVLPVQAISLLLMKSYESHHRVCPEI